MTELSIHNITSIQDESRVALRHLVAQVRQEHVLDECFVHVVISVVRVGLHQLLRPLAPFNYILE